MLLINYQNFLKLKLMHFHYYDTSQMNPTFEHSKTLLLSLAIAKTTQNFNYNGYIY